MKRILCVYATRQIDSNLFMSSTIFNGLMQCGYDVDMLFMGYSSVCEVFKTRYSRYFRTVYFHHINESWISKIAKRKDKAQVAYSFYRSFLMDSLKRPYSINDFAADIVAPYDIVLSFM